MKVNLYSQSSQSVLCSCYSNLGKLFSTASGALVVGGVRDICSSSIEYRWIDPGDRFECSMEYNQSVSGSQWQSVVVCGSLW